MKLTKKLLGVVALAAFGLAASAQIFTPSSRDLKGGKLTNTNPGDPTAPAVRLLQVTTDADGHTITRRCLIEPLTMKQVGPGLPPVWASEPTADTINWAIWVLPVGWHGGWHPNPQRQWVIPISGRWWVRTQDGTRVEMGPGDIHLGDDVGAVPDKDGHVGHDSGVIGNEPLVVMVIALGPNHPFTCVDPQPVT